jgi:hypothetical protein
MLAIAVSACANPPRGYPNPERIADARRGLEEDSAVQARVAEVEAALEREREETPIDAFQFRVAEEYDGDHDVRFLTRIPVPNPGLLRSSRAVRRAETQVSLARLEETALERNAEACVLAIELGGHRETERLYAAYAARQRELIEWDKGRRQVGVRKEGLSLQFEIEREVRLANYLPKLRPVGESQTAVLPAVGGPPRSLPKSRELLRRLVGDRHPSIAVRNATAARYAAMSERAQNAGRPWLDFVDWSYTIEQGRHDEIAGQIAVRVPIGSSSDASAGRYRALERASLHEANQVLEDGIRSALEALEEIERFQHNTARWQALLNLAEEAEEVAERWQRERLAGPPTVAALIDRTHEARRIVLLARMRAGLASCELVATTGVWIDDWPSEP